MAGELDIAWMENGLCAKTPGLGTDDFFLEDRFIKNSAEYRAARDRAKAICRVCPVQQTCLQFAYANDIRDGIWGGTTASERREARWPRQVSA